MSQRQRTFRIFISSTFSDLKAERDALQATVFPRLRELCAAHDFRFHAIDLRWGVRDEASLDQRTMAICLDEIRRCQSITPRPNFVVLLGDRYGWIPLPYEIAADEFDIVRVEFAAGDDRDLLDAWYAPDRNAVPAIRYLRPRTGEYTDRRRWGAIEERLQPALRAAALGAALPEAAMQKYVLSATAQEIMLGAMGVPDAGEHVFAFLRAIDGLPDESAADFLASQPYRDVTADGRIDTNAAVSVGRLQDRLPSRLPGHTRDYRARWTGRGITTDHISQLCADVYAALAGAMLAEISRLKRIDALDDELAAHQAFGRDRAASFVGRAAELRTIQDYVAGDDRHPLVLVGASGAGKSAVMARAAEQASQSPGGPHVLVRFIGATPDSGDPRALVQGLCRELARRYGAPDTVLPSDRRELAAVFADRLGLATRQRPAVLLIDSLDQFADTESPGGWTPRIDWIPHALPPHARLIVSVVAPDNADPRASASAHAAVLRHLSASSRILLPPMSLTEGKSLLRRWLAGAGRTLQRHQAKVILSAFRANGLPLHLRLTFEEARRWRSGDRQPALPAEIAGVIAGLFQRLYRDHGERLVSHGLGYLAASRNGLSEDELLDILSADVPFMDDFVASAHHDVPADGASRRLPVVVWSRLFADLESYLAQRVSDGAALLGFYHRQLGDAATKTFLDGEKGPQRAAVIAGYFAGQLDWLGGDSSSAPARPLPNRRKAWELAFQFTRAGLWDHLQQALADLSRIDAKCAAGMYFDLVADCDRAIAAHPSATASEVRKVLQQAQPAIVARPTLAAQSVFNGMAWVDAPSPALVYAVAMGRRLLERKPFAIVADAPLPTGIATGGDLLIAHGLSASAYAVSPSQSAVAIGAGTPDGQIDVYDLTTGQRLDRRRTGEPVAALAFMEEPCRLVRAGRSGNVVCDGVAANFSGRAGERVLALHPARGLIAVRDDHALVVWPIAAGADVAVLATSVPAPLVALRVSRDGNRVLWVAGTGGGLRAAIHEWYDQEQSWEQTPIVWAGPPSVDADLSADGREVLLLTRDRRLRLLDVSDRQSITVVADIAYEASPAVVRGPPAGCALGAGRLVGRALVSTFDGAIGSWDLSSGQLERLPDYRTKQGDGLLLHLAALAPDDRIFLGADSWAKVTSATATGADTTRHPAAVSRCAIVRGDTVVSISEVGNSVHWHAAHALRPLAVQSHRHPTVAASSEHASGGSDDVLLGNTAGHVWRQSRSTPMPVVATHAFADPVVALAPLASGAVLAAGRAGRIALTDRFGDVGEVLAMSRGFREQRALLPAGAAGLAWSITRDENATPGRDAGTTQTVVTLWSHDRREQVVLIDAQFYEDAAASADGQWLCLAGRWKSRALRRTANGWTSQFERTTPATRAAFAVAGDEDVLVVALADEPWIELWRLAEGLPTLTAVRLSTKVTALVAEGSRIVAGLESGELVSLLLHKRGDVIAAREVV